MNKLNDDYYWYDKATDTVIQCNKTQYRKFLNKNNRVKDAIKYELIANKNVFLEKLKSSGGKNKYKRYLGSPLRYAGGKSLAVGMILDIMPNNIERVVSPFIGGGALEIACAKELKIPVKAFDIFDILVSYWQVQIKSPKKLYSALKQFKPNKDEFYAVKKVMKSHWENEIKLKKIDLAAYYYFNSNTSYGPHFLGWPSTVYLQEERYKKTLEKVKSFDAPLLDVNCQSFEKTIKQYPNDFLYCDPPYYLGEDSKMFVGMYPNRNFPVHHNGFKHELLRDLLLNHKGGFILSYNDCPTIREWYKDCEMITPKWQYTFGQGDTRIGKNREEKNDGSHVKTSHELLIWRLPK